ncbi:MAG TPA: aminoglycoside phosphotransferase family protein [Jiangellales bacterium]|nr:aminoglycoside phosphotransferase family protein [Jiangellales bacterium]
MTGRRVTLVLCTRDGDLLGALPPYDVDSPWWPEVAPVVEGASARYGIDVTILRRIEDGWPRTVPGGRVAYLAEVTDLPTRTAQLQHWPGDPLGPAPLRQTWAHPAGPEQVLRWAEQQLHRAGTAPTGPSTQVRTWNLSSLWRIPTPDGAAWLKVVPPFFAHEGRVLERLDAPGVPTLLAAEGARVLLAEIPGEDKYDAPLPALLTMVRTLLAIQVQWVDRLDELLAIGVPDWRPEPLAALAADTVARTAPELDRAVVAHLDHLLAGLPGRYAAVDACGIPDTLVHGDFHPGNVRGSGDRLVLLDWGDTGVGNPLLDDAAFTERLSDDDTRVVRTEWSAAWRRHVPGCEPDRARELLAPVMALRLAVIYRGFLDRIEPDERIYHAADPVTWLCRAAGLVASRR